MSVDHTPQPSGMDDDEVARLFDEMMGDVDVTDTAADSLHGMDQLDEVLEAPTPYLRDLREAENTYPDNPTEVDRIVAEAEQRRIQDLIEQQPAVVAVVNEMRAIIFGHGSSYISARHLPERPLHEFTEREPNPGRMADHLVGLEMRSLDA